MMWLTYWAGSTPVLLPTQTWQKYWPLRALSQFTKVVALSGIVPQSSLNYFRPSAKSSPRLPVTIRAEAP